MGLYWKAVAAVLLAVVLIWTLRRQEMGVLLGMAVCAMVMAVAMAYLGPVLELVETLQELGGLDEELTSILLKSVGIGLVTEIAGLICADSGNASLGKSLQLLGTVAILWLSVPLFTSLLELIQEMMVG